MSHYIHWTGVLKFKTHSEAFDAVNLMKPWLKEGVAQRAVGRKCLVFPDMFNYEDGCRNLARGVRSVLDNIHSSGVLVGTSNDENGEGYVLGEGRDEYYDLVDWSKKNSKDLYEKFLAVEKFEGSDYDDETEQFYKAVNDLTEAFMDSMTGECLSEPVRPDVKTGEKLFGSILNPGDNVVIRNVFSDTEFCSTVKRFDGVEYEMEGMGNIGHSGFMYDESNPDELVICINCEPLLVIRRES